MTFRVAGLTFRKKAYPENVLDLAEILDEMRAESVRSSSSWGDEQMDFEGPPVLLVRDPTNEHDPNAIEVHVPVLGRRGWLGFVPADLAERWAPRMDDGELVDAQVLSVPIDPEHLNRPGVEVEVAFRLPDDPFAGFPRN